MTDPISPELVERIARGLTKAQRASIPRFSANPFYGYPAGLPKRSLVRLIETGLVEQHDPAGGVGYVKWNLTELGLAVREYLASQPSDARG